ncbi:carboxypeptidase regulatory-like domain-containing protein [Longimicrobium sp.]|uniref:carboxypeptidase regulatory-like domain-containing protein n=1 Tax=Longimicrobium sp. TaxID=2029185 RepID=UPI002F954D16
MLTVQDIQPAKRGQDTTTHPDGIGGNADERYVPKRSHSGGINLLFGPGSLRISPILHRRVSWVRPRGRSFLPIAIVLTMVLVAPAASQVHGAVIEPSGRPVSGVVVVAWVGGRSVESVQTDEQGRFTISRRPQGSEAVFLSFRGMGYRTRTLALTSHDSSVQVVLQAAPLALAPVIVSTAPRRLCPNVEDPRARMLWERMRSRYWAEQADTVFIFGFVEVRQGTETRQDVDLADTGHPSHGWTTGALVTAAPGLMARSGYATPAAGGAGERTAFWTYRALDFGQMMISFCPRSRQPRVGQIEGVLTLSGDTTLARARWAFRTPRPDEDAGGEASYYQPEPATGRALLAHQTRFWRKTTRGRYYFEAREFVDWRRWSR